MNQGGEQYINNSIHMWKEDNLNQQQILNILAFERDSVEKFIKDIGRIKQKIIKK